MFRLDRFLTLSFFGPLAGLLRSNNFRIPILMYHSISSDLENGIHPYYRVVTTPVMFAQQMDFLTEQGYQVIGLEAAIKLLRGDNGVYQSMPTKLVVITFDDGFLDFYTDAFPILAHHNFTATVFLPTSFINAEDRTIMGKTFLTWPQVRELSKAGMTFGSHSVTHNVLVRMARTDVEREVRQSKETIEEKTGRPVRTFSFPYAFPEHDRDFVCFLRDRLQACGYSGAVTTKVGTTAQGDDLFFLKRLPINTDDDSSLLQAKIEGSYNWLHAVQYTAKSVKGILRIRGKSIAKWSSQ